MMTFPLLFAAVIGFNHAFEADHVLAVGNLANRRSNLWHAIRDGLFWGLGHTSMIFALGCLIILSKAVISGTAFDFFEVLVGMSLIALGTYRLTKASRSARIGKRHVPHTHNLAYSIGLLHGLAGSGAVVLVAMSELKHTILIRISLSAPPYINVALGVAAGLFVLGLTLAYNYFTRDLEEEPEAT